jgi:hypothetical protein
MYNFDAFRCVFPLLFAADGSVLVVDALALSAACWKELSGPDLLPVSPLAWPCSNYGARSGAVLASFSHDGAARIYSDFL